MAQLDDKTKRVLRKWALYLILLGLVLFITYVLDKDTEHPLHKTYGRAIAATFGAFITLGLYSFLFGENEVYRFLEHLIVGLVAAMQICIALQETLNPLWLRPVGQGLKAMAGGAWSWELWWLAIPIPFAVFSLIFFTYRKHPWVGAVVAVLFVAIAFYRMYELQDRAGGRFDLKLLWLLAPIPGSLWYTMYSKKYLWLSRLITVFIIGAYIGKGFERDFRNLISQLHGTLKPLWVKSILDEKGWLAAIGAGFSNLVFIVIAFSVLFYFVFTFRAGDHPIARRVHVGSRMFMMIAFGIVFATVVGTRMGLATDRIYFLVEEWAKPIVYSWF